MMNGESENTDREIWRERDGDYYSDSIFVTQDGRIGFNICGRCIVRPLRDWFSLAAPNILFSAIKD